MRLVIHRPIDAGRPHCLAFRTNPFAPEASSRVLGQLPEKCAQTEAMRLGFHFQRESDFVIQPDGNWRSHDGSDQRGQPCSVVEYCNLLA